jgi:hypothetical protein
MTQINFLFLPYHNIGGHFIDWSLYYLTGQTKIWVNGNVVDLPLTTPNSANFHHYELNMIDGFKDCQQVILDINQSSVPVVNVYLTALRLHKALDQQFGVSIEDATSEQIDLAEEYINADCQQMIAWLQSNGHTVAFFDYKDQDYLNIFYNDRAILDYYSKPLNSNEELWNMYTDTFFEQSRDNFDQTVWDQREHLALIVRIKKGVDFMPMVDWHLPHLYYNNDDVWNDLLNVVQEMSTFFQLSFCNDRVEEWQVVYNVWRTRHDPYFARHFDRIMKAIINGEYLSLTRFNLNFYKEVLIQRELIVKYNLNLKTWQLDKFPDNTLELHKLLESNIHTL